MTFRIIGTDTGPIVLSDSERRIGLPSIDSLFHQFYNKHLAENLMGIIKEEPDRCEKIVSKVVDAIVDHETTKYEIRSILANHKKNAFTVVWGDGSHTVIRLQPGDVWDDEKALAMCFVKHLCEDKGNFNDIFTEEMPAKIKHIGNVEPVEEKHECHCSSDTCGPYRDCDGDCHPEKEIKETDSVVEVVVNAGAATANATNAITELIHELSKKNNTGDKNPPSKKRYQVFLRTGLYDDQLLFESDDLQAVEKFIDTDSKTRGHGYYLRVWPSVDGLYIDYGSHSTYFFIPGITIDEWIGK